MRSAKIWLSIVKSIALDTNATWMNKERSMRKKNHERNFVRRKSQKFSWFVKRLSWLKVWKSENCVGEGNTELENLTKNKIISCDKLILSN